MKLTTGCVCDWLIPGCGCVLSGMTSSLHQWGRADQYTHAHTHTHTRTHSTHTHTHTHIHTHNNTICYHCLISLSESQVLLTWSLAPSVLPIIWYATLTGCYMTSTSTSLCQWTSPHALGISHDQYPGCFLYCSVVPQLVHDSTGGHNVVVMTWSAVRCCC